MKQVQINGVKCHKGLVEITAPASYWHFLNPLAKITDEDGNRFTVASMAGFAIAITSAKTKQKVGVICLKTAQKQYEVKSWFWKNYYPPSKRQINHFELNRIKTKNDYYASL